MTEVCRRPIFPKIGFVPIGHCGLHKGHDGYPEKCAVLVETIPKHERDASRQLDLDLSDFWKPIRDLPDEGEELPEYLIPDEL